MTSEARREALLHLVQELSAQERRILLATMRRVAALEAQHRPTEADSLLRDLQALLPATTHA